MKMLLTAINAKYIHSNLAVYSLSAYAKKYAQPKRQDHNTIEIAEYTINNYTDFILEGIYKAKPDVLCFSCYIWNISYVSELAQEFHKLCPHVPIWVGGPEVSYETEKFLKSHREITGVMIGEGEKTFTKLYEYYADGGADLSKIPGIAYRDGEQVHVTQSQETLDMSEIPFCYENVGNFKNRIIYYESSRGCPFSCSYCLSSVEKQLRFRDTALVKQELLFFMQREVPQVKFVDRTFNCRHTHAMEIWTFIKEHDNGITNFHFEISADLLTEEELSLIGSMRPGLIQLEIGVQSTNEATILEIHRTMRLQRLKEVVKEIQGHGNIHEHLDLIAGLPYEDYDTFARSFDEIYALRPNQLQLGFLKVLKGSYMYEHANEYQILYHQRPPYEVLKTKWLDYSDVLRIKQVEEMLEVYYNSGQFEVTLKVLGAVYHSAFLMFQELGAFYERHGYFGMSHSRIRRCEILLEFLELDLPRQGGALHGNVNIETVVDVVRESLVFDLYYRENCKSRPVWAEDPGGWKQTAKLYCKNGKLSHIERFHYRFPEKSVRVLKQLPEYLNEGVFALFDYQNRDPLDYQANVSWVTETGINREAGK